MASQISILLNKPQEKRTQSKTIFGVILESDLPASEKTVSRLQQEAISVTGAGIETTMRALSLCTFHILANPPVMERLQAELKEAIPDPRHPPNWDALSQLPYLAACIDEGEFPLPLPLPPQTPTPSGWLFAHVTTSSDE